MSDKIPRTILNFADVGILVMADTKQAEPDYLEPLRQLKLPMQTFENTDLPAWKDETVWAVLERQRWRQVLVIAPAPSAYSSGLVLMALQKGFEVFFACQDFRRKRQNRLSRLQNASAIILSIEDAVSELIATKP